MKTMQRTETSHTHRSTGMTRRHTDIEKIEERYGHSLLGRFGSISGYAVVRKARGEWWPVYWDGREGHELDVEAHPLRAALQTAAYAKRESARLGLDS
jgi:hypothetical protein